MVADEYQWMARDATESERLNQQHRLLVKTVGYLLHPKVSLPPNARVADIATGSGAIILDLAKALPETTRFDGFDISDLQFPSNPPKNVEFHVTDVKQPLPPELHEQFNLVVIRFLNAGMRPEDWEVVTHNVSALLKTGGWLQWIEGDFSQIRFWQRLNPLQASNGAEQEIRELIGLAAFEPFAYCALELADTFRRVGLTNVSQDVTSSDRLPETRLAWTDTTIGPIRRLLLHIQRSQQGGKSPEYCAQLCDKILEEAYAGAIYPRYDIHTFLGQKA